MQDKKTLKVKSPARRAAARGHFQARIVGCGLPSLPVCLLFPFAPTRPTRPGPSSDPVLSTQPAFPPRQKEETHLHLHHLTSLSTVAVGARSITLPAKPTPPLLSSNTHVHLAGPRPRLHQRRPLPFSKHKTPPYFVADGIGSRRQTPRQHFPRGHCRSRATGASSNLAREQLALETEEKEEGKRASLLSA